MKNLPKSLSLSPQGRTLFAHMDRTGSISAREAMAEYGSRHYRVVFDGGRRCVALGANLILAGPKVAFPAPAPKEDVFAQGTSVFVFDQKNPDRLLGYLTTRPVSRLQGPVISIPVATRPSWFDMEPDSPVAARFDRVDFQVNRKHSGDGLTVAVIFTTSAPIQLLMKLPTFRLPGETEAQAQYRLCA